MAKEGIPLPGELPQTAMLKEFRYYSEFSDELLVAINSEHGYQICKLISKAMHLIEEANK